MGKSVTHKIDGKEYTPTELSAAVLKKLKVDVENRIGPISEAVITIPANFSQEARDATMEAGRRPTERQIHQRADGGGAYYAYQADSDMGSTYAVFDLAAARSTYQSSR